MQLMSKLSQLTVLILAAMPNALAAGGPPAPDVPAGVGEPFTRTCYQIHLKDRKILEALCTRRDGGQRFTWLNLDHCLENRRTLGFGWKSEGKWSETACNISPANCGTDNPPDPELPTLDGETMLRAALQTTEGRHRYDFVDLAIGVVNDNGFLTCFGVHDGE